MGCCSSSTKVESIDLEQVNRSAENKSSRQQEKEKEEEEKKQKKQVETSNLATEIKNWKTLIDTLQKNASLNAYALARKRSDFPTLDDLFAYISAYKCQNQYEQAWLIYVWITDNIEYNMEGLLSGDLGQNDPDSLLRTGLSVCEGFARLFEQLCQVVGIECRKISGYSKAFGYSIGDKLTKTDHAWNTIKIGGKWYYVEATWGAGYADSVTNKNVKRFEPYWFLTPPTLFMYEHYSESCQLQGNPITLREFEELPKLDLKFHLYGLELLSHNSSTIVAKSESPLLIEFFAPEQTLVMGTLKDAQSGIKVENSVFIQRDFRDKSKYAVRIVLPRKNTFYTFELFAKEAQSNQKTYSGVAEFRVIRNAGNEHCNTRFLETFAHTYDAYLSSPLDFNLRANQSYSFECYIKGASDVALVDSSSVWYHFTLTNPGLMLWTLDQSISAPGELKLYAKPSGSQDRQFNAIARYNVI